MTPDEIEREIERLEMELMYGLSRQAAETCPACIAKRVHTEDDWALHPGEGRMGSRSDVHDPSRPSRRSCRSGRCS